MTDRYKKVRKALAMGPTPGPWSVRYDYVVQAMSFDEGRLVPIAQPYGLRVDGSDLFANAALVAACDPDTIRELLAERDQLAAALEAAREDAADAEGALRVAVLALAHASECNPVYMPAYIHVSAAIDQARGKAGQEVGGG